jgi:hypothetical protein
MQASTPGLTTLHLDASGTTENVASGSAGSGTTLRTLAVVTLFESMTCSFGVQVVSSGSGNAPPPPFGATVTGPTGRIFEASGTMFSGPLSCAPGRYTIFIAADSFAGGPAQTASITYSGRFTFR